METIMQGLVLIAMFALRLAAPAAVILALAYVFKGLDRHWQEQAEARAPQERRGPGAGQAAIRSPARPRSRQGHARPTVALRSHRGGSPSPGW